MKLFHVVSTEKTGGKTFLTSLIIKSLIEYKYNTAYYIPFQMKSEVNFLPDINYIRRNTTLAPSDIYCSYALGGSNPPLFSSERKIDIREIRDFIIDMEEENMYDAILLEGIGIYEPVAKNETFIDVLKSVKRIQNNLILVSPYSENIVDNLLLTVEGIYRNNLSVSMTVINQNKNAPLNDGIVGYLTKLLSPIEVFILPYIENDIGDTATPIEFENIKNKILSMM